MKKAGVPHPVFMRDEVDKMNDDDIQNLTLESMRKQIGYVSQDVYLFHGTVRENIAYGDFGATRDEVEKAAKLAHIHDIIMELPDAYDTMVGERGLKLSGGEKQRVAIARVILKNPRILIFDEATSALDNKTEMNVMNSISNLDSDLTIFIIAHRLTTLKHCHKIIQLENGEISFSGSYAELNVRQN